PRGSACRAGGGRRRAQPSARAPSTPPPYVDRPPWRRLIGRRQRAGLAEREDAAVNRELPVAGLGAEELEPDLVVGVALPEQGAGPVRGATGVGGRGWRIPGHGLAAAGDLGVNA